MKKDPHYNCELYRSIRKNGLNNFSFEIIEECDVKELNKREQHWIKYYDSFHNGYNYTIGGDSGHTQNKEKINSIINDLKYTKLTQKEIAEKRNITEEMVQGINTGRYWRQDIVYPIRHIEKKEFLCKICKNKIYRGSAICISCLTKIREERIPSKEELEKHILKYSMLQIGKIYNVSDNAVRKWCKKYGLPYKYNDIKEFRLKHFVQ